MKKILFFGDSITAFRKDVVTASEMFAEHYPQYRIVNKGVGGDEEKLVALLPDGMHPTTEGQRIIFHLLLDRMSAS